MDIRQLLTTVTRRWKLVAAVFFLSLGSSVVLTSLATPLYKSTVLVYVSASGTGTGATQEAYQLGLYASQRTNSYAALIKDPQVLEKIGRTAGSPLTSAQLAGRITATAVSNSVVLQIDAVAGNPNQARDLAAASGTVIADLISDLETPPATGKFPDPRPTIIGKVPGSASFEPSAISPNAPLNVTVGMLLGLLLGVAASLLRESLDRSLKSPEELTNATGASILSVIPFDSSVERYPLISHSGASSLRAEPYRVLRTNLQFIDVDSERQLFLITSAMASEGKTTTAANLAIAVAQAGKSVLLIDADLRKSSVSRLLGLDGAIGLMTAATGRAELEDCIQVHESGLNVLATGPMPPNPAEVLDTKTVRAILDRAHELYEVVIVDGPPVLPVADAAILAGRIGHVLLVVQQGRTKAEHVRQTVSRLHSVGAHVSGVIASMTPKQLLDAYGEAYHYYYGYTDQPIPAKEPGRG